MALGALSTISPSHYEPLSHTLSSNNDKYIARTNFDKVTIFDAVTAQELTCLASDEYDRSSGICLQFSENGKYLAMLRYSFNVIVWDAITFQKITILESACYSHELIFSPSSKYLVVQGHNSMEVWDMQTCQRLHHHSYIGFGQFNVQFSMDETVLMVASSKNAADIDIISLETFGKEVSSNCRSCKNWVV